MTYETAISIMLFAAMYVVYKGSVDIPAQYWFLKMFMYVGSLGLMLSGVNYALTIAGSNGASDGVVSTITSFYAASIIITLVAVGTVTLITLKYVLHFGLGIAKRISGKNDESENTQGL